MKWFTEINTLEELRNRYKHLLIKYHPDNNPGADTTAIMQQINAEYDELLKHFTSNQTSNSKNDYSTEAELKNVLNEAVKLKANITIELIGTWIWIKGDTYPIKTRLKELGFRWASKKGMWCWGTMAHSCHKTMDMSYIRQKYGSTVYKARQPEREALNVH